VRRTAPLQERLRTPLYRNAYALVLSSGLSSVIGGAYWLVAARLFSPEVVGLNSAGISAMLFIAGIAQLNLTNVLVRFVPVAGRASRKVVVVAYVATALLAAVCSLVFVLRLGFFAPELVSLLDGPVPAAWFVLATMGSCIYVLQDGVLTGLHQAGWVPIKNVVFAVAKLGLLAVFVGLVPRYGIIASWTLPLLVVLLPITWLIFHRLLPRHVDATRDGHQLPAPAHIARYVVGDYLGAMAWLAATTLLPVIVVREAGASATAYFFLTWQIAFLLYNVGADMGSAMVAEASASREQLARYSRRVTAEAMRLVLPIAVLLIVGAPLILGVFGAAYANEGSALLRLLALAAIPNTINAVYVSVARVERRIGNIVVLLGVLAAAVLGLAVVLLPALGITGVGLAWLTAQTLCAVVVYVAHLRHLWHSRLPGAA
jgi:O-antigen/teichoic acid export membrane protein